MRTVFYLSIRRLTFALGMASLLLLAQQASAACTCDPNMSFANRAEWAGPYSAQASVDVNQGNSPESFINAAYWQIAGTAAPAAFVTDHANRLRTWGYWRRIDTVNTILTSTGNATKPRVFSDPWTTEPALTSAPCKTLARDVGAVFMLFFNCPAPPGYNCGMDWANNHAIGMESGNGLYGGGLYDRGNVSFYQTELMDARYAGLQFFLPDIYGWEMGEGDIDRLKTALDNIAAGGIASQVKVGMFDDSWGWGQRSQAVPDMTNTVTASDYIFNNKWAPYFDKIPDAYRYKVGGKPLIYLYSAGNILNANDYNVFARLKTLFQARYGVLPYLVVDVAYWNASGAANMATVADNQFTWRPATNLPNGNSSTFTQGGITLTHSMPRWDPVERDSNGDVNRVANSSDGIIKGAQYLQNALTSSQSSNLLVFATWNDLGEGTGINRTRDYYDQGNWLAPTYFMDQIRASQSQQTCGVLLPTPTATPTISPTFTLTPTATHGPLVTDMEVVSSQDRTYWNGGAIVQYTDSNGTTSNHSPWTPSAGTSPGASGTGYAACWSGTLVASSPTANIYPYSFLAFELMPNGAANSTNGGQFTNVLPYSSNKGIQFNYKASAPGILYQVELNTSEVLDYGYYAYQWTSVDTAWHSITVYFPDVASTPRFAQPAWAVQRAWDPTSVGAIIFQPVPQTSIVNYGLCIDDLTFLVPVGPTFTPTPSATRTASPSSTRTPSSTPTATPSASPTQTAVLPTATPSTTPSRSSTPTSSATATVPAATSTPTLTSSLTLSGTPSSTGTLSPANTPGASATRTSTGSATPSASPTPSPSATRTGSPTPSDSPSATRSSTASATPSSSASPSITVTATPVPAGSSATPTPTQSPSFSASPTASPSATRSATPSASPSATQTRTVSVTGTATPSSSPLPSASASPTSSPLITSSPSASPLISATQTAGPSATLTPASTATLSPAASATKSPVSSSTVTPGSSATQTPAAPTVTAIPTTPPPFTKTASPSASQTSTVLASASATPVAPPASPVSTATPSATLSPSPSATRTATALSTALPSAVATATATPTASPTRTSTALPAGLAPDGGILPPKIEALVAFPNPQHGPHFSVRVKLQGPADGLSLRCYSRGMTQVGAAERQEALAAGWQELGFEAALPAGSYYVQVRSQAREGRGETDRKTVKLMVLP
jgi:hypothetical protein